MDPSKLHVITAISNPVRYRSRYDLYRKFEKYVADSGATLWTVEMAFGDRPFEVTQADNPRHIQVRSFFELWAKEGLLTLGLNRLPASAEYVAWIDADVKFTRDDWAVETIQQLQHYYFVQMFAQAQDLGPRNEPVGPLHNGFVYSWYHDLKWKPGYTSWHSGYSWAGRRDALDLVGGFIDHGILGSGDRHMACALIGRVQDSYHEGVHPNYKELCLEWQRRAEKYIRRDIGYVDTTLYHYWHGAKPNRKYADRWKILVEEQFDPYRHIYRDSQGLYRLDDDAPINLRDKIRRYFRSRHEDDIFTGEYRLLA